MPGAGIGGVSASPAAPFEFEPPVDCWAGPAEPGIELDGTPPDPVFPVLSAPPPGDPTPLPMPEPAAPPAPPVPPALPAEPPLLEPPPPPPPAWAKAIGAAVTDKAVTSAKVCNRWEIMNSSGARRRRSASDNLQMELAVSAWLTVWDGSSPLCPCPCGWFQQCRPWPFEPKRLARLGRQATVCVRTAGSFANGKRANVWIWHEAEVSPTSAIWPRAAISRGFRPVDPEIGDGIVWRFVPAGNIETGCKPAGVPDGWLHQTASAPPSMLAEPPNN
jgi:hypothetical protein